MKSIYFENRYFANRVLDEPIMREISQGWKMNISYSEDGSVTEIVFPDAKKKPASVRIQITVSQLNFATTQMTTVI